MLHIRRQPGEGIIIETPAGNVKVVLLTDWQSGGPLIAIDAPHNWPIYREEKAVNHRPRFRIGDKL